MEFLIRLDQINDRTIMDPLISDFISLYGQGIAVHENPDNECSNPHYHIWLFSSSKVQAIRDKFKRMFSVSGNAQYSINSKKSGDIKYLLKQSIPCIVFNNKFTQQEVDDNINKWQVKSEGKSEGKSRQGKARQVKASWYDELSQYCMQQMKDYNFQVNTIRSVAEEVAVHIQFYYLDKIKCEPNDFQLRCYVKSIVKWMVYELDNSPLKKSYKRYAEIRASEICGDMFVSHVNFFSNMVIKENGT